MAPDAASGAGAVVRYPIMDVFDVMAAEAPVALHDCDGHA